MNKTSNIKMMAIEKVDDISAVTDTNVIDKGLPGRREPVLTPSSERIIAV